MQNLEEVLNRISNNNSRECPPAAINPPAPASILSNSYSNMNNNAFMRTPHATPYTGHPTYSNFMFNHAYELHPGE